MIPPAIKSRSSIVYLELKQANFHGSHVSHTKILVNWMFWLNCNFFKFITFNVGFSCNTSEIKILRMAIFMLSSRKSKERIGVDFL